MTVHRTEQRKHVRGGELDAVEQPRQQVIHEHVLRAVDVFR